MKAITIMPVKDKTIIMVVYQTTYQNSSVNRYNWGNLKKRINCDIDLLLYLTGVKMYFYCMNALVNWIGATLT